MFTKIEEIEVWKRGCSLVIKIFAIVKTPTLIKEKWMRDQLCRSALSIPSNIAEGFERESSIEFKRFLLIAKGSCGELRTQLYISQESALLDKTSCEKLIKECSEISSMLSGLIRHIKNSPKFKS